jgi:hypothetical protein
LHDLSHANQVLAVPIAGWKYESLVEEVVDGVQQVVALVDGVRGLLKFLEQKFNVT